MTQSKFVLASLVLFTLGLCLASQASAAPVYLLDFNTVATDYPSGNGGYPLGASAWNIYAAPSNINGGIIKDTAGSTAAGITLAWSGTMSDSSNGNNGAFTNATGGPSWVTNDGSLGQANAAADYFFTSTGSGNESFTVTFGGLTPGMQVSLDLWFSRLDTNAIGFYDYSLDGGSTWFGFTVLNKDGTPTTANGWNGVNTKAKSFHGQNDGNNFARYMNSGTITLTGNTLAFRTTDDDANGSYSGISAVRLTAVPEPSSLALAATGLLSLAACCRNRRRRSRGGR